jgi:uncharacterized protein
MLTEPLPATLDARKATARGVSISGSLDVPELPRLLGLLADDRGTIEAQLVFSRDEENRHVIDVDVDATVNVTCQRCLEPMAVQLRASNRLALVWTDEQAGHLPRQLDPLLLGEEACNLWELVEDELILSLPITSYHDTAACNKTSGGVAPAAEQAVAEDKSNPFNVLEQLKPGHK